MAEKSAWVAASFGSSDSGDVTPVAGDAVEITTGGTTASYGDYQTSYLTSAADNVVTVKSGTYTSSIYGSYGGDGGTSNKVSIGAVGTDGPSITGDVLGDSGTGTTYFNEVTVNSGTINGTVYGAKSNTATYNTITVNGGTITGGIYGAYSTSDANGAINSNTLNLLGGKVSGAIYGGYSENGSLGDNNINLKGTDVSGASLYGAAGTGSGMDTNTLNVYTLGNSVVNLGGFQNINFYIPDTAKSTENATPVFSASCRRGFETRQKHSGSTGLRMLWRTVLTSSRTNGAGEDLPPRTWSAVKPWLGSWP